MKCIIGKKTDPEDGTNLILVAGPIQVCWITESGLAGFVVYEHQGSLTKAGAPARKGSLLEINTSTG